MYIHKQATVVLLQSNELYKALDTLKDLRLLDKMEFSDAPIEACPRVKDAFYFMMSKASWETLQCCDTHINNMLYDVQDAVKKEIIYALTQFKNFCEACPESVEYYVINKELI